ncbi:MAG TPA: pyrrolo-quinoline quinone [Blastocatellia bacterium]|nr:pyrrolo-quinoline quinone [Blastocatellia bacterium]
MNITVQKHPAADFPRLPWIQRIRAWAIRVALSILSFVAIVAGPHAIGPIHAAEPYRTGRPSSARSKTSVLTQHNDNARTGANLQETVLNVSNVNPTQFGKLFIRAVDGFIHAQPLIASSVEIPGKSARDLVFVATEHNSVYAFDATNPADSTPVWVAHLGAPVPSSAISAAYRDMGPEIGITSTPVIDPGSNTIYVVAKTGNPADGSIHQALHALDIRDGREKLGGPVEIAATIEPGKSNTPAVRVKPGRTTKQQPKSAATGVAEHATTGVSFDAARQLNRPALLLSRGIVYLAFGSHGDHPPYHGWVLGYDASTLKQVAVFNTTPNGSRGAIWQGGQGLAADADGFIYLATGNGTFDANEAGGTDFGESVLKLSPSHGLEVVDWFTPGNHEYMDSIDADLGSGGPVLIPDTGLLAVAGKDGVLRVIDRHRMGHYDDVHNQDVQEFKASIREFFGGAVYWNGSKTGPEIYLWGQGDFLKAFKLSHGIFAEHAASQSTMRGAFGLSDTAPLSISANSDAHAAGIVWAACPDDADATYQTVPGVLRAFDAEDLSHELWDSKLNAARDELGKFAKFCAPTVANGKVYVATCSGQLVVYGLLNPRASNGG